MPENQYFLYGSMGSSPILNVILEGANIAVSASKASCADAVLPANPGPFALAEASTGKNLNGVVLGDLTEDQSARLAFFMSAVGGTLQVVECRIGDKPQTALTVFGQDQHRSDSTPVVQIEQEAAREIMGYFGRLKPEVVKARLPMILARAGAQEAAQTPKPAQIRSDTAHVQVRLHKRDTTHEGFFLTRSYQLNHPKFDGTTSDVLTREAFVATDAAIVLPYDAKRDRVLLVEQFRMGPYARGDARPWMLEPVAGRVDGGESPETCARRECEEEAGLTLHALHKISSHYCTPGCSTEYFHVFLGLCDLPDGSATHGGLDTEHEDLRLHVLDFADAMRLLETGEADNGPLVLALLWLSQSRERLRASA